MMVSPIASMEIKFFPIEFLWLLVMSMVSEFFLELGHYYIFSLDVGRYYIFMFVVESYLYSGEPFLLWTGGGF